MLDNYWKNIIYQCTKDFFQYTLILSKSNNVFIQIIFLYSLKLLKNNIILLLFLSF